MGAFFLSLQKIEGKKRKGKKMVQKKEERKISP